MRPIGILSCLLALVPVILFAAAADDLELGGVMTDQGKVTVLLKDKASGRTRWVVPGEGIAGYTYVSFNDKTQSVTVSRNGVNGQLQLKTSKVLSTNAPAPATAVPAPPTPAGIPAPNAPANQAAIDRAALNNLRQLAAAADQYYLENGVSKATLADLVGQDKYVRQIITVGGEDYSKLEFSQGKPLVLPFSDGRNITYSP